MLTDGAYAGHVAIVLKQSAPFPFLELKPAIRAKVYRYLLKHDKDAIGVTLKQGITKTPYSPGYGGKNNLAILATSKQISTEAATILYSQKFHFAGTQVVASFLLHIGQFRRYLVKIRLDSYNSNSAKIMFHLLQDAKCLKILSFAHISSDNVPKTAVRNMFADTKVWLLGVDKEDPTKGLDTLFFDPSAFHMREKDEDGKITVVQWGETERREFFKGLRILCQKHCRSYQK